MTFGVNLLPPALRPKPPGGLYGTGPGGPNPNAPYNPMYNPGGPGAPDLSFLNDPNNPYNQPVDNGGGGGDGGGYDDSEAVNAQIAAEQAQQLARLQQGYAQAGVQIDAAASDLRSRFAGLQQTQQLASMQAGTQAAQDGQNAQANYNAATAPIVSDLQKQGFSAAPVQQQVTMDQQRMADYQARQADLMRSFGQVQDRSFADRNAAAEMMTFGAKGALANTYYQATLDAAGGGGGGGGGGGRGGGGYGGGSGTDTLTAGDASLVADLAEDPRANNPVTALADNYLGNKRDDAYLGAYLHGTQGKGNKFVPAGFGHVSGGGAHADALKAKFIRRYTAKYGDQPHRLKAFKKAINKQADAVKSNAGTRRGAIITTRKAKNKGRGRGLVE